MAGFRSEHSLKDQGDIKTFELPSNWSWKPTIHIEFDGQDDVLEMACRSDTSWKSQRISRNNDAVLGTDTWSEAIHIAEHGWPKGRESLVQHTGVNGIQTAAVAAGWRFDFGGAYPDVPRFLGGELDCMVDFQPVQQNFRPIVRIVVSPITFGDVSSQAIVNWGAALVSWIDELERSGRRVEVTWMSCSQPSWVSQQEKANNIGGPRVAFSFCLKDADQPVEIDRLAFWIMHPAAQRRIQFALKEQMDIEPWYENAYGTPISNVDFLAKTFAKEAIVFTMGDGAPSVNAGIQAMKAQADSFLGLQTA